MSQDPWAVELGRGIGPIDLGATRQQIAERLKEVKIELDIDDEDDWLWVEEIDAELHFKTTTPQTLLEIMVQGADARFAGKPVLGQRLHEIVELLQVSDAETQWRFEDNEVRQQSASNGNIPARDEELLDEGTLWIPSLGLGLGMIRGEIDTVRLRKPEESPQRGVGTLTPAHRQLSARKDLPTYLRRSGNALARPATWFQSLLTVALGISLVLLFLKAVNYQQQWNQAPVVEGTITAVDPPPPDPFPMKFTVAYSDVSGVDRTTVFERADIYVNTVGDKVEVRYLPEAPDKPMGPARYRDAAFVKYFPWGIGLVAVYLVLQVAATVFGWLLQRSRAATLLPPVSQT